MRYLMGIDSGLTVTKAAIFDEVGNLVGVGRADVPRHEPKPRHVERDMDEHWDATCLAIRRALEAAGLTGADIAAVGMSGHGDGLYPVDRAGRPLGRAILSLDSRAIPLANRWREEGRMARLLPVIGEEPAVSAPGPVIAWVKENEPERYARLGHVLYCKDWLRLKLTGELATDVSEASVAFTDVHSQRYDRRVLDLYGMPELWDRLPPVREPTEIAGKVTAEAAALTGLVAGTPVATGLHDVTATAVGMGVINAGQLALVGGTYSINQILSDHPVTGKAWFCRSGWRMGLWMNMAISPASATNIDWFVTQFCKDAAIEGRNRGVSLFEVLEPELVAAFNGHGGIVYHPFLYGSPHGDHASAAFLGVLGMHKRGDLMRALIEGVVFNHRTHVDGLRQAFTPSEAALGGGSSRSPRIAQLFADTLNLRITVPTTEEAGALGVAMCAGVAVGRFPSLPEAVATCCRPLRTYEPDPARVPVLDEAYRTYRSTVDAVAPVWPKLGATS